MQENKILVWDFPTRLFHWLLAISFIVAYLTAEEDGLAYLHLLFGYSFLSLLIFRLVWGLVGSRYARFAEFLRGPQAIIDYVRSLIAGQPRHYTGHNPLGGIAVLLLILLGLASAASGWLFLQSTDSELWEEAHEILSNLLLAAVIVHLIGVFVSSKLHGENLVLAMLTGKKSGQAEDGIPSAKHLVAALLLAMLALVWIWAWNAPQSQVWSSDGQAGARQEIGDDDD